MTRRLPDSAYWMIGRVLTHPRFHPFHRRLYRRTGGRWLVGRGLGVDMLLLQTTGRQSGLARTVPLAAVPLAAAPHVDTWVVVGSFGGRHRDPDWAHNLRATPEARIQVRGSVRPVTAREAHGDEAAALWPIVEAAYPGYALYRAATTRLVPLFVLEVGGQQIMDG